jgi:asparagine synthase (glutamine-hydrolysing)
MCGISGIYHFGNEAPVERGLLEQMNAAQHYRGPDEGGTLVNPRIGFGNRRLAILDRAHGQQPMRNADGTVWITYNGEVFNYAALRAELQAQGYQFRTTGDTEVVLHAYEAYGEHCVDRLNGQFAFGVWDERLSRLFLARDRLGIAPLHYALTNGRFVFASEAKAIFADPAFTPAIDHEAIAESLLCGTLFGGRTLFRGVETLPPGHWMMVSSTGCSLAEYWDIPLESDVPDDEAESHYAGRILPLVEDALQLRLVGEVPWGLMLSGGTDSSTLATLASRMASEPVQTFTIDFPNRWKGTNVDAHYAAIMARHLHTRHFEFMTKPDDYYDTLERVTWHLERPFNKGASTMYLLYKQLKAHATVVITGEGADELFAGYVGERGLGLDEVMQQRAITRFPWAAYWEVTEQLFNEEFRRAIRPAEVFRQRLHDALPATKNGDILNDALYLYTKYFLLELLELHDRTSLASGVEARLPFLDHRLVELLSPMPSRLKVRDGRTKYLFKEVVKSLLPPEIIERKKTPMPIPRDPETLRLHLRLTRELLTEPLSRTAVYYDLPKVVDFLDTANAFAGVDALCVWKVSTYLLTLELLHRGFHL